jgi:hypothetical protein
MSGLIWNGGAVEAELVRRLSDALGEIGLRIEAKAKQQLVKGHGVITGTLRRSIHCAEPGYNWADDDAMMADVSAARAAYRGSKGIAGNVKARIPELGGKEADAKEKGSALWIVVGSGLRYAMPVHQGHGSFEGYHFITNALEQVEPQAMSIMRKHCR